MTIAARRRQVLEDAAQRLRTECPQADVHIAVVDLADAEQIVSLCNRATSSMGGGDILVCNAALIEHASLEAMPDVTIDAMAQVNIAANVRLCREVLPEMRTRKWGRIIFCSSIVAERPGAGEGLTLYATCKGAINSLTRVLAVEAGADGITVNSLASASI